VLAVKNKSLSYGKGEKWELIEALKGAISSWQPFSSLLLQL
jgi:hypothetical protein